MTNQTGTVFRSNWPNPLQSYCKICITVKRQLALVSFPVCKRTPFCIPITMMCNSFLKEKPLGVVLYGHFNEINEKWVAQNPHMLLATLH